MRSSIPTVCLALLIIIFASWYWGGVTPGARLVAIAGGILIFIFILLVISFRASLPLSLNSNLLLPLTLILTAGLIQLSSPVPAPGRILFWEIISCSLLMASIILSRPSRTAFLIFIFFILVWGSLLSLYGFIQLGKTSQTSIHLSGTFVNRNHFCAFLGLIAPLTLIFSLEAKGKGLRYLSRFSLLCLLVAILLTRSRGGLLAAAVSISAVLLIHIFSRGKRYQAGLFVFLLILLGVGAFILLTPRLHFASSPNWQELSVQTRLSIWKSTLKMFIAHPWLGWGWGTFKYVYPRFKEAQVWYTVPHAHNEFLQFLAEGGIVGFVALTFCLVGTLSRLFKGFYSLRSDYLKLFSLGAAGSLIYALVHSGFDFILRIPANVYLLTAIVGLGLSTCLPSRRAPEIASRRGKIAFVLPVIFILLFLVLYPQLRFYLAHIQWEKGRELIGAGKPRSALVRFSRAADLDSHSSRAFYDRALARMKIFEQSGDKIRLHGEILSDLKDARQNNPWDFRPLWALSDFYRKLHAPQKAEEALKEALALNPTDPYLLHALARIELIQGEDKAAALNLQRASAIYPCIWDASLKLLFSSTEDYQILKELPPPEDRFHLSLGYHLWGKKKWEEAREEFHKSIALNPENPANWRALGKVYFHTQNLVESEKAYEKALSLSPRDAWLWSELGDIFMRQGLEEKTLEAYKKAHELDPKNKYFSEKTGNIILKTKGFKTAAQFWETVADKNPGKSWPHYARADLFFKNNDIMEARREITVALERSPGHSHYLKLKKQIDDAALKN